MMRFPPRRILVAVDLSVPSGHAWRMAGELARRFGAVLRAVHCDLPLPVEMAAYATADVEDAQRRRTIAELRRRLGAQARLSVARGYPEDILPRLARDRRFDLIVIGTHRRRGLARVFMGSVAEAVTRASPCPVLVVARRRAIHKVLAPINETDYARRGLAAAGVVARALRARLFVMHAVTDPLFGPNPRKLLRTRIAELPAAVRRDTRPTSEATQGDPVSDILRATRGKDLVVLTAHRKSLLGDWVLGTTVERVLRYSPIPVLSIPSGARRTGTVII